MERKRTYNPQDEQRHAYYQVGRRPRAFLVGLEVFAEHSAWSAQDSLQELIQLADTAGLEVVGSTYQKLTKPYPKYYIGPGKAQEIADLKGELHYELVVFDDELTGSQTRNLEQLLQTRVIDRTQLILDIFAQHAQTREGRLQVELAQHEYLLPRLRGQWGHLSRQTAQGAAGGSAVGVRGPGETQLETDRRLVGRRIAFLKEQLEEVRRHRERYRQRRRQSGIPVISLVGYTNAGKSTLLNALSGAGVRAENQLFATLDPTTRQVTLPGGRQILLTDTVGFIQRLPTTLVAAFRATLEEIREADLLLHVLDITHPNAEEQSETVLETLADLEVDDKPILTVLNKVDAMPGVTAESIGRVAEEMNLPADYIPISAEHGWGLAALLERIEQTLAGRMSPLEALIPYTRNDLVAVWRQQGVLETEEYLESGIHVTGRLPLHLLSQFAPFRVESVKDPG
ncbi:GTPase HflX [Kallotenue papyrolyticum]|uniref:GTPase HflX n=1 Tax=Kallotenue papyrolyticum TaxID=1325125 RepID=UPI000492707D|nr:GTPase HflX [Kallotenue papyrolyticum]